MSFDLVFLLALGGPVECGNGSPALPIPASRAGVELWSDALQPADPPDVPLPASRDSTDDLSTTIPSQASGHELFYAVDGVGALAAVAYNVGLQLWRIEADGTMMLAAAADGIANEFLFHPPAGRTAAGTPAFAWVLVGLVAARGRRRSHGKNSRPRSSMHSTIARGSAVEGSSTPAGTVAAEGSSPRGSAGTGPDFT